MRIYRVCGHNGCRLSDTILFSFNRESYFRIWTKENPALNVEKNALDLSCTCGGKHELKAHKTCLFFYFVLSCSPVRVKRAVYTNSQLMKNIFESRCLE